MKKVFIIVISIVLVLGIVFVGAGLILTKGNLNELFKKETRTEKHVDETAAVTSFTLDIASDNAEFYTSPDENLHIDYWDSDRTPYVYSYSNGTATLKQDFSVKNWFNWFGWIGHDEKIVKIYLPASVNATLKIRLASGNVDVNSCPVSVERLEINLSSGNVIVKDAAAKTVNIRMSSGNAALENVISENVSAALSSGDLSLTNCQIATTLDTDHSSGNCTLNGVTVNRLVGNLSSGNITANNLIVNEIDIDTSSGNIELRLKGDPIDYRADINISSGSVRMEGKGVNIDTDSDLNWGTGSKNIQCKVSSGSVKIYFVD